MTTSEERPDDAYQDPTDECDLVMKGGIASGVVYPPAILELAKKYSLRGIGGASAGAIAAAAAAAAEYGRRNPKPGAGFRGLEQLREELESGKRIQELFEPAPPTAALYRFFMDLQESATKDAPDSEPGMFTWLGRFTKALVRRAPLGFFAGALLACVILHLAMRPVDVLHAALLAPGPSSIGLAILVWALAVPSAYGCAVAGGVLRLKRCFDALCSRDRTFFGFCLGSRGEDGEQPLRLTDWLHEGINRMAGYGADEPPLTIDELASRSIDFRMVTTNLSHARPNILPWKGGRLFFKLSDFERLFPPSVVRYLMRPDTRERYEDPPERREGSPRVQIHTKKLKDGLRLPKGYYPLPRGGKLPVIVAVRLSLSFPILLSQVRLYSIKDETFERINREQSGEKARRSAGGAPIDLTPKDFDESWFSDGGIAANFPLSIFDNWVPKRPTFGINLCDGPLPSRFADIAQRDAVFRLEANETSRALPRPKAIGGLFDMLFAMLDTARSARDNAQMELPSYRERVAHVYLKQDEGGLNLNMGEETLKAIGKKGEEAAATFLGKRGRPEFNFDEHRWVRLLQLMDHMERELFAARSAAAPHGGTVAETEKNIEDLLKKPRAGWYRPHQKQDWPDEAKRRLTALFTMIDTWDPRPHVPVTDAESSSEVAAFRAPAASPSPPAEDAVFFQNDAPLPASALRVTSEV